MQIKIIFILLIISINLKAEVATKENVAKLYVATFNRAPDAIGLDYWVNQSGLSLENIAKSFFDQPETKETYASFSNIQEFILAVYTNLFARQPDIAGSSYWDNELSLGTIHSAEFILAAVNGAKDSDKTILDNKTTVGLAFAQAGLSDISDALDIMSAVTSSTQSVVDALEKYSLGNPQQITNDEIKSVVDRTNQIRQIFYADAPIQWSQTLANSAQTYANNIASTGITKHSNSDYGENLIAASYAINYTQATNEWYAENSYYDYSNNSCESGKVCGHYTQLIWKETTKMGCGSAIYSTGKYIGWSVVICHYNPPGNYVGETPY